MLVAAAFCLPFNGLMLGLNNLLFLLYPVRHPTGTTFDFQMFGKMMLFFFLQIVLLLPLLGIPAAMGGAAYFLAGYSWPAFVVTTWLMLAAELLPLVLAVAWAFLGSMSARRPRPDGANAPRPLGRPVPRGRESTAMHPALWTLIRLYGKSSGVDC